MIQNVIPKLKGNLCYSYFTVLMVESITQMIVSLDGFFKKGLVELMLLNVFFIHNNYFFDASNSVQNLSYLYILKFLFWSKKNKFDHFFFNSRFQIDFVRPNDALQ